MLLPKQTVKTLLGILKYSTVLAKAKEFGIPTRTEPELVEFLMQLKLNELVPPKLYAAVAEVLAWAYEVDGKTVPNPNNVVIDR